MSYKKVLVAGMGKSGMASVIKSLELGSEVLAYDKKSIEAMASETISILEEKKVHCFFGRDPKAEELEKLDAIIISPGVFPEPDFIENARSKGVEVIGELEFAYRLGTGKFIAITGTNGKTTTTTLVGEIVKKAGRDTVVAGNIGIPVVEKATRGTEHTVFVTEVSSFQLETIKTFKPQVSAILNITPDHLDRHGTVENYAQVKARIFENQSSEEYLIVNKDDLQAWKISNKAMATRVPFSIKEELDFGCFVKDGKIKIADGKGTKDVIKISELQIPGEHNLENALAACAVCYFFGIDVEDIRKGLTDFKGVEHRIEIFADKNGVKYVNDSKGTNTDATIKAIKAMEKNIILIAGGYDKGADFHELIKEFKGKVKAMIVLGETKKQLMEAARDEGFTTFSEAADMEEAVRIAGDSAMSGDVVLLSPACASWDMYSNFEMRGNHFKKCVRELIGEK